MQPEQGQRVIIAKARGNRKKFNGRCGEVVDVHERNREGAEPFVFVYVDESTGPRVFAPSELRAEEEG